MEGTKEIWLIFAIIPIGFKASHKWPIAAVTNLYDLVIWR